VYSQKATIKIGIMFR